MPTFQADWESGVKSGTTQVGVKEEASRRVEGVVWSHVFGDNREGTSTLYRKEQI